MFSVEEALETPISEFVYWRLDLKCRNCNRRAEFFLQSIVWKNGGGYLLVDVVERLRCKVCHAKPSGGMLANQRLPGGAPNPPWVDMNSPYGSMRQLVLWDEEG
jgi:hypothetical protein